MKPGLYPLFLMTIWASAIAEESYLDYDLPENAVKTGPAMNWGNRSKSIKYFLPGPPTLKTKVGEDEVQHGKVIKRELFKDGRKHGIQREWYPSGALRSESPYRAGSREGLFKEWDETGQLIASYEMKDGTGTVRRFDSNGKIVEMGHMLRDRWDGYRVIKEEETYGIIRYENDARVGIAADFLVGSGLLDSYVSHDKRGALSGPSFSLRDGKPLVAIVWYLNGEEVKEAEYARAAAADPEIPPYFSDWQEYLKRIPKEMTDLLQLCQTTKVKIPLEFDAQGDPVPAP